jgi:magnesium-transporting ATPase (P-type)
MYLEGYAKDGLRTLLLGQKELSQAQYDEFQQKMKEASQSMTERDERIEEVASEMERGFTLVGSTAIEDQLQDDVDGTIKFMREAGIRVWVLTGDKIETAINIGFSCKLLTNDMQQYLIDGANESAVLDQISEHRKNQINSEGLTDSATIVAGDSLFKIMANERIKENFL